MKTRWICAILALVVMPVLADNREDYLLRWLKRSNAVYSPLEAAEYGSVEQMQKAIEAEPTQVNDTDELGRTALHLAAARGDVALVGILLEAGADASAKNAAGHQAIEVAQGEDVINLLKTAGVAREKELALSKAVKNGKIKEVKAALAAGVNVNALNEDKTGNMLSVAVLADNVEMVKLLLSAGADVNAVPHGAKSVLHCAAVRSNGEIVRALLAAGADPMHPGNNGACALHEAIWAGNSAAVEALIPAYASCNFSPDGRHNGYPVGMAIMRGRADYVQLFLNAGMDVNDKRFAKEPLLHQAVKHNRVFMVKMLLDAGAKRDARDAHGKKAVEYAQGEAYELLK